jgi:hypothetical protein
VQHWSAFIAHASSRQCLIDVEDASQAIDTLVPHVISYGGSD